MARAFRQGSPVTGKPGGIGSKFLRTDLRPGDVFDSLIETKCPRLAWARASICPCKGFNTQTEQVDPTCPSCNGLGWTYFRPPSYAVDTAILGKLTDEQAAVVEKAKAVVVRGLMTGLETDPDMFRVLGNWVFGTSRLTMRAENRAGYYDRIVNIDEIMVYSEIVGVSGKGTLPTKYPVVDINALRSLVTVFGDKDVELKAGTVTWLSGKEPATGTLVTINYNCHPVWVVVSHIHVTRSTLAQFKKRPHLLQTPEGDTVLLPVQVMVRLEHLALNPS